MSWLKALDFDTYGLLRATHYHVYTTLWSMLNMCLLHDGINRKVLSVKLYRIMDAGISVRNKMFYDFMDLRFEMEKGAGLKMGFINKEKVLRGIGKAVDVTNEAADKVSVYVKEKELDKKALNAANEVGDAMKSAGKVIENKLSKLSNK